ncbi:peptidoglycan-binding protein [Streptomyces arenae]|uniref:peptidoglycan-binding protein n=1 Tax=Streptomyces arenae TaxID=29301 RepID=UPI00265A07B3|nr:peptidoglycan-binding protein [Streptomyces arenae]MCG7210770.1 peptidoglycan-binding protein [Streptomyces arenae]
MSRWKALPAELDPRVRQLVVRLRRLKDHSGLSMRQLAARTGYSPKSWERYLGGRSLPPVEAVAALARIGGDDPTRLLTLREVAAEAWENGKDRGRTAVPAGTPAPAPEPEPEPVSPSPSAAPAAATAATAEIRLSVRSLRIALAAGAVALVLAVSSAVLVTSWLTGRSGAADDGTPRTAPLAASAPASTPSYSCRLKRVDGAWYAGNSRTRDATVGYGESGPDVVEVQCLLRRAGVSPGGIDGMFGPLTRGAVVRFQKRAGLIGDGIVGPRTWKALRG